MSKAVSENFLEAAFGNYLDCIKNSVYSLQKYIDIFHYTMNNVYLDYDSLDNKELKELFRFVVLESESISKVKALSFVIETEGFLNKKYESLVACIKEDRKGRKYRISEEAYLYLDERMNDVLFNRSSIHNPYNKTEDKIKDIYQFTDYMKKEFETHREKKFRFSEKPLSNTELVHFLDGAFMKISMCMLTLKQDIEKSNSIYNSAVICRDVISLLIVSYVVVSTVKFAN